MERMRFANDGDQPVIGTFGLGVWVVAHIGILTILAVLMTTVEREIGLYCAFWYTVAIGPIQALMLRPLVPGSWRPIIVVAVAAVVACLAIWAMLVLWYVSLMVAHLFPDALRVSGEDVVAWLPLAGWALAGLVQMWVLDPRWRRTPILVGVQAALAMLLSLAFRAGFGGRSAYLGNDSTTERLVFGVGTGVIIALVTYLAVMRLSLRPASELPPAELPPARLPAALPESAAGVSSTAITPKDAVMWVAAHVGLLVALNFFFPMAPRSPLFVAFAYGPTVGLLQALLLHWQFTPGASLLMRWVTPTVVAPPVAALLSILPVTLAVYLAIQLGAPSPMGRGPAGFPVMNSLYPLFLVSLGSCLALGLLHWRQLRQFSRGPGWSALYLLAQTVAPLMLTGIATWTLPLMPGYRPPRSIFLDVTTIYTMSGAALGGLGVALLVGGALWLMVRPRKP